MKLIWAFNPFDVNRKLQQRAVATVKAIAGPRDRLEAVYVASPFEVNLATAFDVPVMIRFSGYPKRLVETGLLKLGLRRARGTVITVESISLSDAARALASHAAQQHADLMLVASHARKGVPRLFLGSFAETLVHLSKTDLLVFHEDTRVWKRGPAVLLYAHDLSRGGDRGFEKALVHAKRWKSALHVIHVPEPAYGIRFDDQDPRVDAYRRRVRKQIAGVESRLKRARIEGSVTLDPQWAPISELVLAHAKRVHADLVLVFAKSGPLAGFMGGSVTRQILRASAAPVLVLKGS
jgi:nucleotide-binding universal stress UspA family protein